MKFYYSIQWMKWMKFLKNKFFPKFTTCHFKIYINCSVAKMLVTDVAIYLSCHCKYYIFIVILITCKGFCALKNRC